MALSSTPVPWAWPEAVDSVEKLRLLTAERAGTAAAGGACGRLSGWACYTAAVVAMAEWMDLGSSGALGMGTRPVRRRRRERWPWQRGFFPLLELLLS